MTCLNLNAGRAAALAAAITLVLPMSNTALAAAATEVAAKPALNTTTEAPASLATSPLVAAWPGAYGGLPPFDKVKVADFQAALEYGMAEELREVEAIANNPAPPTFDNTIAAMERSGRALERTATIFSIHTDTLSTPEVQAVETAVAPKMAAHGDAITQNSALFARIEAVYNTRTTSGLTPEQQRLTWRVYTNFARTGAKLDAAKKQRLGAINQELAGLYTQFSQHLLGDEARVTFLTSEADLAGLPPSLVKAYANAAADAGKAGQWAIANTRSSVEPFLESSTRRDLREKVWREFIDRGDHADANDNNTLITRILQLRFERAQLLGYATHAHWRLENAMAKTPERAIELMEAVWKPAVARVHEEVADMQKLADAEAAAGGAKITIAPITIAPWDYRYYAEKVRAARYAYDSGAVKPYLQLEKLREGMFWVAGQLFGFQFKPVAAGSVPVYHPDVRVWEVLGADGKHVGLWYFDPYARVGKNSGAWMNAYRSQSKFDGAVTTIVSNNANFVKGSPGEPLLVSWDDAKTLFHEFGHALHGLSSNVNYPSLAGTAVARDYVEFPSQLLEHWLSTPEVLNQFARHVKTGEPMPAELAAKIARAETFNEGFRTVEYLSSALIDMKLHLAGGKTINPDQFERETLASLGMPAEMVMRHRTPQFGHVFSGDGYSAGYYSYLWSDTLTADAFEAFTEATGPYDPAVAKRLRDNVFDVGNTVDPADGYRAFRGRDPGIGALMRKRGFPVP
jgi:peptidyl-dipeptidase Dcp